MKKRKALCLSVLMLAALAAGCNNQSGSDTSASKVESSAAVVTESSQESSKAEKITESSSDEESSKAESSAAESKTEESSAAESKEEESSAPESKAQESSAAESSAEISVQESSEAVQVVWQEEYVKAAEGFYNEYVTNLGEPTSMMFQIVDINSDGLPELIISPGEGYNMGCHVFTCHDGKVTDTGIVGVYGVLKYHQALKQVANRDVHFGMMKLVIWEINNGKAEEVINAGGPVVDNDPGWGDTIPSYTLSGKDVSKEEYFRTVSGYLTDTFELRSDWVNIGRQYTFTLENVRNAAYAWQ